MSGSQIGINPGCSDMENVASVVSCWDTTDLKRTASSAPVKGIKPMERDIISTAQSREWVPHSGVHVINPVIVKENSVLSFQKVTDSWASLISSIFGFHACVETHCYHKSIRGRAHLHCIIQCSQWQHMSEQASATDRNSLVRIYFSAMSGGR